MTTGKGVSITIELEWRWPQFGTKMVGVVVIVVLTAATEMVVRRTILRRTQRI
jgi:hypothetical protein